MDKIFSKNYANWPVNVEKWKKIKFLFFSIFFSFFLFPSSINFERVFTKTQAKWCPRSRFDNLASGNEDSRMLGAFGFREFRLT